MKRIYHVWSDWECYPAGFYENHPTDASFTDDQCRTVYAEFLRDIPLFKATMTAVLRDWPTSCEHYLSNESMNRIAWLGQASLCHSKGIPAVFRGGYNLLSPAEKLAADTAALEYLNQWLTLRGEPALDLKSAASKTEANLY
jgi:hypothetical protein